jgi:hypothetical protein
MLRGSLLLLALLAAGVVSTELWVPSYLEGRIEDRLTDRGGRVTTSLEGEPAFRLLLSDGERVAIEGGGIRVELTSEGTGERARIFEKLDGFDEVLVRLRHFRAGPFKARRLVLTRSKQSDDYGLEIRASVSARDLGQFAASRLGSLAGRAAGLALAGKSEPIPIRIDFRLRSDDGRATVTSGEGTVAGIGTGSVGKVMAGAVLERL